MYKRIFDIEKGSVVGIQKWTKKDNFPQTLFVLYGDGNQGKTTTLTELVFILIGDPTIIANLKSKNINRKTKKYKNGCYVIFYKGK